MSLLRLEGNFEMPTQSVEIAHVADLPYGRGNIGERFENDAQKEAFHQVLAEEIRPLTITNTADCGDGREILRMADGTEGPALENRVTFQLFGGIGLAVTKAAVAADMSFVKDAKTFKAAYEKTVMGVLVPLGYADAAHEGCGASKSVEVSVAKGLTVVEAVIMPNLLLPGNFNMTRQMQTIYETKDRKLGDGFYGDWDSEWHEDFVRQRFPENFATLRTMDNPTNGHHEVEAEAILKQGYGLAKNALIRRTEGGQVFAVTPPLVHLLAKQVSVSEQERERFTIAAFDDMGQVSNQLILRGMGVNAIQ